MKIAQTGRACLVASLLWCFLGSPDAHAQQVAKITTSNAIGYYEYVPPGYNSNTDNYPLVIFLHGLGERGNGTTELTRVAANGPPKYVKNGTQFPFILVSPQLKSTFGDWYPWYIDEVIERAKATLRVDPTRVYLTGLSLGGGGVWYYIQDAVKVKKITAAAIVCGSRNAPPQACVLTNEHLPVWAFHGTSDTTVPSFKTVQMINAMNACLPLASPSPLITLYPGVAHNSWDNAYRNDNTLHTPNVYQWLLGFTKPGLFVNTPIDYSLALPVNSTTVTATATTTNGVISSYLWTKVSGPAVVLANTTSPTVSLTGMVAGSYNFRVRVTNSLGEAVEDVITIVVTGANIPPVANAGPPINLTLPTNSVVLNGSGTDANGTIASYAWAKVSGPAVTLGPTNINNLSLTNLVAGTYVFSLTVTDNNGATSLSTTSVTVGTGANVAPTANAGGNKIINLPTSTTTLIGSGTDDGSIAAYLWEKLSGPAVTMTNTTTSTLSLSALQAGIYQFRLKVTDNLGLTGVSTAQVTVNAANIAPTASAGSDFSITLPTNSTNVVGSGSDVDGFVASYLWTKMSGPAATLSNTTLNTLSASTMVAGAYTFRITVTDDDGATSVDDVIVTVNAAPVNTPPVANAGPDFSITLPLNTATLTGSGTDANGVISTYAWTKVSGPAATLTGASTNALGVTFSAAGTYQFRLTVTDNQGATHFDEATITVQPAAVNQSPIASAGSDVGVTLPISTITLNGSGTDADGTIATYAWTKQSGPAATLTGATTNTLQLSALVAGSYVFRLTVTDDDGASNFDDVSLSVAAANVPPDADAGADIVVTLPTGSATITGSATDLDGTIASYQWTQVSGAPISLSGQTTNTLGVSGFASGTYIFRLTATDDDGATDFDEMKLTVNAPANVAPVANAGPPQAITLPLNTTNLPGSGFDADGTITSYTWTKLSGPAATLTNASSPTLSVTVTTAGAYVFRLTVTDNAGTTDFDEVTLTVQPAAINQLPVANAGSSQSITMPINTVVLSGTGTDPDGSIASYQWIKLSGGVATLTNANTSTVTVTGLDVGAYMFRLTVTDNSGASASSDVAVNVIPATVNQSPVADAGANQSIQLPLNSITIFGGASDADGSIATYAWTKLSGPVAGTLINANTPTLSLSGLAQGVYVFRLSVVDDQGADDTDDVNISVLSAAANLPPVADAGPPRTIILPTAIVTLTGSGSDPEGAIASYLWTKMSGPSVTMGAANTAFLSLSDLVEGTYVFELFVADAAGNTDSDEVTVNVLPATINLPPAVSAGGDKTIFLPANSVILNGTVTDADGTVVSQEWSQVSGPGGALISDEASLTPTIDNLTEGVFIFRLTAIDDDGSSEFSEVSVTVNNAALNQPPVADAGPDSNIKLPANDITIPGTGTDPDGTVASYLWTKIGGPPATFSGMATPTLTVTFMEEGTYLFSLTVTDDEGATDTDDIQVTVLSSAINSTPEVDAGSNVNVQLPTSTATLTATATDDVAVTSTEWTQIEGPSTATIASPSALSTNVSGLVAGTYTFRITAKDVEDLTATDDVDVSVTESIPPPTAPIVTAGNDLEIQLPVTETSLMAVAASDNGLIVSYKWTQVSGAAVILDPDTASVVDIFDLVPGNYSFRVTVTDASNLTASDEVNLKVLEENPTLRPQNMVSPNADGQSDAWVMANPELATGCQVQVYTRGGQKVFESEGYDTPWDGTYRGEQLEPGVYFYVINCSGDKKSGSITLIR